jgi:hypothetical protein
MKKQNIHKYLVTAATVFSVEKWLKKWLAEGYLDALLAKQAEKCLPHYFSRNSISQTSYPEDFVELVRSWSFSNRSRFLFLTTLEGREGSYNPEISLIKLPKSWGNLETLVHEVTHALRPTSHAQPQGASYLGFMRDRLCEEIVAESSRYYGYDGSKQILKDFSSGAIFWDYSVISECIKQDDKETLIESAAYAVLSKNCFKRAGWITDYRSSKLKHFNGFV